MNKEVQSIIRNLQNTLSGDPWFGRAMYPILEEVDVTKVYSKPGNSGHSCIELLYHMITWAGFTLRRLDENLIRSEDRRSGLAGNKSGYSYMAGWS